MIILAFSKKGPLKMSFSIRKGKPEDMLNVLALIQELADFEKESNAVELTVEDLKRDGFGAQPLFNTFVAEMDGDIVAMALFYPRYSTWKGPTIHLEDLIVKKAYRGKNIGSALFKEVIQYGADQGVKRIEWVVLDWNDPAIDFYEKRGAKVLRDWDTAQLEGEAIHQFLKQF